MLGGAEYQVFDFRNPPFTLATSHLSPPYHLNATLAMSSLNLQEGLPLAWWSNTTHEPETSTPYRLRKTRQDCSSYLPPTPRWFVFLHKSRIFLTNTTATGTPCDSDGYDLKQGAQPKAQQRETPPSSWLPFHSQVQFEAADFLFKKAEMSQGNIDILMELWASTAGDGQAPFQDHREMLVTINAIKNGDAPWQSFTASYSGTRPPKDPPDWMLKDYTVFFHDPLTVVRNIISNPDFDGQFDYAPYTEFEDEKQRWSDLMSGNWAWKQAVSFI